METSTATQGNELIKVSAFQDIIATSPNVLSLNQQSADKAAAYGQTLIDTIEAQGMSDELDKACNDYLVKLKKTCEQMNDRRKPITQIMDEFKKVFTSLEGAIDSKGKDNVYTKIQAHRNEFAARKAREAQEKEREVQRKLAVEKERVSVKAYIEQYLSTAFLDYLARSKKTLVDLFETITLANFDSVSKQVIDYNTAYPKEQFEGVMPVANTVHLTQQETIGLIVSAKTEALFNDFANRFRSEIIDYKTRAIDKLPSKRAELTAMANANAEEQKRLADQAAARKAEEDKRLADEAIANQLKADQDAEAKKQAGLANAMFDAQLEMPATNSGAQVREGYNIEVTNQVGYMLIVSFYFEKEGKGEDYEKLEKKTLGSMKKFAEAYALKHGEKIQSPYLIYDEVYKAVAKK